jgi:hypothetical protein
MAAIMKLDSYHISGPIDGLCKSHDLWIGEGNSYAPLIYFKKPAWIKDEEMWRRIVSSVRITLPSGVEIQ